MGIASLLIAILVFVSSVLRDVVLTAVEASAQLPARDAPANYVFNGWQLANIVLGLVGIVFGIGGVLQKNRRHGVAVAGLVMNILLPMLFLIGLVFALREDEYRRADGASRGVVEETRGAYPPGPPNFKPLVIGSVPFALILIWWRRLRRARLATEAGATAFFGQTHLPHCSRCRKPRPLESRFCRRCGMNFSPVPAPM
jgi:hypothetical protein